MIRPPHTRSTALLSVLIAVFTGLVGLAGAVAVPTAASAVQATGHGVGFESPFGAWIGSYRLADGSLGFCLQAGKAAPTGHDFDYVDGPSLGWVSQDDAARLAYISRNWGASADPVTAAAGQLATWTIAGLNGNAPGHYAERAGHQAGAVLARAQSMLDEASARASRGVTAAVTLSVPETGASTVRVDLIVDFLGGVSTLGAGAHPGSLTLKGARFDDGSSTHEIRSGAPYPITPTGTDPAVRVEATARFDALEYGAGFRVAHNPGEVQNLLIAAPATVTATAAASLDAVSPLPFQPTVTTLTSASVAAAGQSIFDRLTIGVREEPGLLPSWGVYDDGTALRPIPVVVKSSLLGPFDEIVAADAAPAEAPVVCTVQLTVSAPGEYLTPECTLPAPGRYVWVERIDQQDTPREHGQTRLRPWASAFGVASETTTVPAPPPPAPPAPEQPVVAPVMNPVAPAQSSKPAELAETGSDAIPPMIGALVACLAGLGGLLLARRTRERRLSGGTPR